MQCEPLGPVLSGADDEEGAEDGENDGEDDVEEVEPGVDGEERAAGVQRVPLLHWQLGLVTLGSHPQIRLLAAVDWRRLMDSLQIKLYLRFICVCYLYISFLGKVYFLCMRSIFPLYEKYISCVSKYISFV